MGEKLSIKQIAQLANVSVATISRVMNQSGGYSTETEEKVKKVIEKYHYIPNSVAKGLRTNKTPIIGIVVPDIANEYFAKLTWDIQTELFEYDYLTMVCNVNESVELENKYIRALEAQNVSGIILISGTTNSVKVEHIPTVYVDRKPANEEEQSNVVIVESDNTNGGYLAARELIQAGCKRIAFVTGSQSEGTKIARYKGYCKALEESGMEVNSELVIRCASVIAEEAKKSVINKMEKGLEFDGVVCSTDTLAMGTILALKDRGKQVPEDVKVTGFDDISLTEVFEPSITTVHQYGDKMAKIVVKCMIDLIGKELIEKMHYVVPVGLVIRNSTKTE
jgi:LacI family transcriptional regulator